MHSPADPFATAMVVERGHVAWVGSEGAADAFADGVDEIVDLEGALVTPAFTDAHVHTTATGLALTGLDLSSARTLAEALDAVRAHAAARPGDRVLLGGGWDAARWTERRHPSRAELDAATGGRPLYLPRVDVHSAVVTTALLDLVPGVRGLAGYRDGEPLDGAAHHAVRAAAHGRSPGPARRGAARRAAATPPRSASAPSTSAAGPRSPTRTTSPRCSPWPARKPGPRVFGYWAERVAGAKDADRIRELGAVGAAGDLFVDGSLGSHTACLHAPYADAPARRRPATWTPPTSPPMSPRAPRPDIQAGFHAIGDAAVTAVVEGVRAAAERVGLARVRAARHRVEHAEMLTPHTIAAFAELGLTASVQPAFDALWGGDGGHVRRAARRRAGPHPQPVRRPAERRRAAGVRLRLAGDPAGPVGDRARGRLPPHP